MTIEQLLCPAVINWEKNFRKQLNESHIDMSNEQIIEEFDKWLIENEDVINKSVEDNIEHINETIQRNMKKHKKLNEGIFDDDAFDDDENGNDEIDVDSNTEDDEPVSGEVEDDKNEEPEEKRNSITGSILLSDNKKSKNNIFSVINDFYDMVEEEGTYDQTHIAIMKKLDVSGITNMCALFAFTNLPNLDLSTWDTGMVKMMEGMFYKSTFNNESICNWNVSSCADFRNMFLFCPFKYSLKAWTPRFVEKTFRNQDGSYEKRMVRADLPILGGTEDETRAAAKIAHRSMFSEFRADETNENKNNNDKMIHLVDYDTFINEGKFRDFIDRGIDKVKKVFNTLMLKAGDIVAFFKKDGEMYPATSAYTSMNVVASGKVPGVSVFTAVENEFTENIDKEASIVPSAEYYGIIDKDSVEYRNYLTFAGAVNEHYQKYGDTGALVGLNEGEYKRVGFSAKDGGVVAQDINSEDLREILEDLVLNVPAYKGDKHGGAVFIWGAPGIGKSTIPKSIVKAWNEKKGDSMHKKALMVVQCGDLTIDGFSLPIPVEKSIEQYLNERPNLKNNITASGVSLDSIESIKKNMHKVSIEAPKTWLPAFKMDATQEEIDVLNDIANGYLEMKNVNGKIVKKETTEGGILLFDEFFRANEEIFKILMQLILNREYSGYMLGNKWGILCCSNRPNDDEEVSRGFERTGAVVGNRMLGGAYNFIPSFDDWKKWAVKEGGFDPITLEFLMFAKNPEGEYTNWHTIRPDEYTSRGKTAWPTPRSWSALMNELNLYKENHGYDNIVDIPNSKLLRIATGIIGEDMAQSYVSFLKSHKGSIAVDVNKIMEDPEYVIPETSKCTDVVRQIENNILVVYSSDDLPPVDYMMNMFNNLAKTYGGSKDNIVKLAHINIMKHFNVLKNRANRIALKEYLQAVEKKYGLEEKDFA